MDPISYLLRKSLQSAHPQTWCTMRDEEGDPLQGIII